MADGTPPTFAIAPPPRSLCQEASPQSHKTYIPCNRPARFIIANRDTHAYAMCEMCADYNVRNRSAHYVVEGEKFVLWTPSAEPVPVAPAALQFTVDQVVALYQKTRAEIDVLAAAHQKTLDPLNARVDLCKAWLLKYLTDQKLENARTEHGLIYKSQVMSATVDPDGGWEQLFGYILEAVLERALDAVGRNASDEDILTAAMQAPTLALLNHAVNKTAVKELLEQQIVVPGVKIVHVVQLKVGKS